MLEHFRDCNVIRSVFLTVISVFFLCIDVDGAVADTIRDIQRAISGVKREISTVERDLSRAGRRVKQIGEYIDDAVRTTRRLVSSEERLRREHRLGASLLGDAEQLLARVQGELENAVNVERSLSTMLKDARTAVDVAEAQLVRRDAELKQQVDITEAARASERAIAGSLSEIQDSLAIAEEKLSEVVRQQSDLYLRKELILFDFSVPVGLTYNAEFGTYWADIRFPNGLKLDKSKISALLNGSLSVPDLDPIAVFNSAAFARVEQTQGYEDWSRRELGLWRASKRWTDFAGAEEQVDEVVAAVLSAGASLEGTAANIKEYALLEFADIVSWLRARGITAAESTAANLLAEMLSIAESGSANPAREFIDVLPDVAIAAGIDAVPYVFKVSSRADIQLPIKDFLNLEIPQVSTSVNSSHIGPWIRLGLSEEQDVKALLQQRLNLLRERLQSGPQQRLDDILAVERASAPLARFDLPSLAELNTDEIAAMIRDMLADSAVFSALSFDEVDLARSNGPVSIGAGATLDPFSGVIDLKSTALAREIEALLHGLRVGNRAYVTVEELSIDLLTLSFQFEAVVRNRHSLGWLRDVLASVEKELIKRVEAARAALGDTERSLQHARLIVSSSSSLEALVRRELGQAEISLREAKLNVLDVEPELDDAARQVSDLRDRRDKISRRVSDLRRVIDRLSRDVDVVVRRVANARQVERNLRDSERTARRLVSDLERKLKPLNRRLRNLGRELRRLRRVMNPLPRVRIPSPF